MIFVKDKKFYTVAFFVIIFISSPLNTIKSTSSSYWPTNGWVRIDPLAVRLNASTLNDMEIYINNWNNAHQQSHLDSVSVFYRNYLVKDWYYLLWDENDLHSLWSVTKSFTGTLMGIAIQEGFIPSVNEFILDYFSDRNISNVDTRKEAITIEHLLMMSTGLAYPGDDQIWTSWMNALDQVQFILNLPMATTPGRIFNYDTGGSHLLSAIIQKATNMTMVDFALRYLFKPLGITKFNWQADKQNITYGGHGLFLTPGDMAKLGYLYSHDGYWHGKKILPTNWVNNVTQRVWELGGGWGYGQQWWTFSYLEAYCARGRYGQSIYVLPEHDIIVVFTASLSVSEPEPYITIITDYILSAFIDPINPQVMLAYSIFYPFVFVLFSVIVTIVIKRVKKIT
ncbi:MAG: serine hydrolase [Candidatus Heimdallarchaeota archaeon]|nr:serine hydrolase [Candidatus Heimdallarchaeota archaeon]